ncbi:MAG: hypothetical protein QOE90_2694 [Thermoplasmata archaeon]|jgi:hypothetical protein|nr:hypothetical protein [Thermoplasmata archaeon]
MRTLAILTALALLALAGATSIAGADDPCAGGTANADGTCTYAGSFVAPGVIGALGANTKQNGIDSVFFPSPGADWFLVAHLVSVTSTPATAYDLDIHYYTAAGVHVDSKNAATNPRADHCDGPSPGVDSACLVPDFGADNAGMQFDVDAKITAPGVSYQFVVTAYPPGTCPAAYPDCGDTDLY